MHLLVLIEFVIQFTMQVMNSTKMKVVSCEDGGWWVELSEGGGWNCLSVVGGTV